MPGPHAKLTQSRRNKCFALREAGKQRLTVHSLSLSLSVSAVPLNSESRAFTTQAKHFLTIAVVTNGAIKNKTQTTSDKVEYDD